MKIAISAREMLDRGIWPHFCELRHINVWALNEGLLGEGDEFTLSEKEAQSLGVLKEVYDGSGQDNQ